MSNTIAIIIRLLGDPEQGLSSYVDVSLIDEAGSGKQLLGIPLKSPPIVSVLESQELYQTLHQDWGKYSQWGDYPRGMTIPPDQIHHYSGGEEQKKRNLCHEANIDRIRQLDLWLNECLQPILGDILAKVFAQSQDTPIRLVIETSNTKLQNLPWEKCAKLIRNLKKGDHHVSTMISRETIAHNYDWHDPLNVLVILGRDDNINTSKDLLKVQHHLPSNSSLRILDKPKLSELIEDLYDRPQDIIIFAGHSMTNPDDRDGKIFINDTESLSINDIGNAFTTAIKQGGLKLLLLNSCEGMGLARRLTKSPELKGKSLPHIIVMRQRVSDTIAHEFLEHFLQFFFVQKHSLERSVTEARQRIEHHEKSSPGASSLPVLWGGTKVCPLKLVSPPVVSSQPSLVKRLMIALDRPVFARKLISTITLGSGLLVAALTWQLQQHSQPKYTPCDPAQQQLVYLSCGEKSVLKDLHLDVKAKQGMQAFRAGNYQQAVQYLNESWKIQQRNPENNPEVLIALENAQIKLRQKRAADRREPMPIVKTIAVVIPATLEGYLPIGLLAAVAQAQSRWNGDRHHEWLLQVVIGNDYNDPDLAKSGVVREILQRPNILGVVGHYSSSITKEVLANYHSAETVLISGTSTSTDLNSMSPFFFRTVNANNVQVSNIVQYLERKKIKRLYLLHGMKTFALTFKNELVRQCKDRQIVVHSDGLSDSDLNPKSVLKKIKSHDSQLLILSPDGFVNKKDSENVHQIIINNAGVVPIIGNEVVNEPWLIDQVRQQPELGRNLTISLAWHKATDVNNLAPQSLNFIPDWWQDKNGQISTRTVLTYDATNVLIEAINMAVERQLLDDDLKIRKEIVKIIPTREFAGITGKITFNNSERQEQMQGLVHPRFDDRGKFQGFEKPE